MYYRPIGFYWAIGYYSTYYMMAYYDGYGYNFYTGKYGYYENSKNETKSEMGSLVGTLVMCFVIIPCVCFLMCKYCGDEDEHVGVKTTEEVTVVEEVGPDGTKRVVTKKRRIEEDDSSSDGGYTSSSYESERRYVDHKGKGYN